ncbi:Phosphoheptose isomerase 1 [hydrothermal vent metagenome]|uniref:D-sedoheptulose-7-phosphate isomerase n=1 Tax=hydrothermal vent metagenome TaxID=652676 RepID=A0A3B1BSR2_9ZZZZ
MKETIARGMKASAELKLSMLDGGLQETVADISRCLIDALISGGKVLIAGNGGSAGDAQHMAAEFVGRYLKERDALPAIALTTDTSALTSIGNDYGFKKIFSRQLEALGKKNDVFIAISTSGNSKNLIEALKTAGGMGIFTVCLLGRGGGEMKDAADISLVIPSDDTPRVQEAHIMVIHLICEAVENAMEDEK